MKKIKFLVKVSDKYTKEEYVEGQVKEFNNERADEIMQARQSDGQPFAVESKEEIVEEAIKKVETETATKKVSKKKVAKKK